jgi:hypothetical protein
VVSSTAKPLEPAKKDKIKKPCEGCADVVEDQVPAPARPTRRRRR